MVDDMTWKAAMSSEIFREFVAAELRKEADEEANRDQEFIEKLEREADEQLEVLRSFDEFETNIRKSPALLKKFQTIKQALIHNQNIVDKVDQRFVHGIMMLDLDDREEDVLLEVSIEGEE